MYSLFLDDTRQPHEAFFRKHKSFSITDWVTVCSVQEAIDVIAARGIPDYISFDYDLEIGFSLPLVDFICQQDLGDISGHFDYDIHSANKYGYSLIRQKLESFLGREFVQDAY
jgi:hypothetical protein